MSERRNTLLNLSWQLELTCSMSVALTLSSVTGELARIEALRLVSDR